MDLSNTVMAWQISILLFCFCSSGAFHRPVNAAGPLSEDLPNTLENRHVVEKDIVDSNVPHISQGIAPRQHLGQAPLSSHSASAVRKMSRNSNAAADFSHWILALYWPPTVLSKSAQQRAQHLIHTKKVTPGFWTHGLWPVRADGTLPSNCTTEAYSPADLGAFRVSLDYYMQPFDVTLEETKADTFYGHEWDKHGTCTGMHQLGYFMAVFQGSFRVFLKDKLSNHSITVSRAKGYTFKEWTDAIDASFPGSLIGNEGLVCYSTKNPAVFRVQEIRMCLDKDKLKPIKCPVNAGPPFSSSTCGAKDDDIILFPVYSRMSYGIRLPWGRIFGFLACVIVVMGAVGGAYYWLQNTNFIPMLFLAKNPKVVHYDLVHMPVKVCSEYIDMEWLWHNGPSFAEFIEDLPIGMGIKGGIARKLMKVKYGTPEPASKFDIDVVIFVDMYLPEIRKACREIVTGMKVGSLILEAQDVEVLTKEWIPDYFMTRDVTQNEVLILKVAGNKSYLFYTMDCYRDVQQNLIRPSVHSLKSEFQVMWNLEDDGTPYMGDQGVARSIVRFLKGHGDDYAFDRATWDHFRREKLSKIILFKILKPFHKDDAKMQLAIDHLIEIGFISAHEVRKAGGVNTLWGLLLQELNSTVSKFGGRLTLGDMDTEDVERWVDSKKAMVGTKLLAMEMKARRTGYVQADESVQDLGLLTFPEELVAFMHSDIVFDYEEYLKETTQHAVQTLLSGQSGEVPEFTHLAEVEKSSGSCDSNSDRSLADAKSRWKAAQRMAMTTNEAIMRITEREEGPQYERLLGEDSKRDIETLRTLLGVEEAKALQAQKDLMAKRANKQMKAVEANMMSKEGPYRSLSRKGGLSTLREHEVDDGSSSNTGDGVVVCEGSGSGVGGNDGGPDDYLRYSAYGMAMARQNTLHGSFYQAAIGSSLAWDEEGSVPLIRDDERPQKKRVQLMRLLVFIMGVLDIGKWHLLVSYVLLLFGLSLKLIIPKIEGAIFDAFNLYDDIMFTQGVIAAAMLVAISGVFSLAGRVALEVFTKRTMSTVFARFYEHLIFQELSFFSRLNLGELMARTSGDSLTLRSLVSSTLYQFVEGGVLFVGSIVFILASAGGLVFRVPSILLVFVLFLTIDVLEATVFGAIVRTLNLMVRQALGRMFGFTLDSFNNIATVSSLNMEPKLVLDYALFANDYFLNTFKMNITTNVHRTFTYFVGAALRGLVLWLGGKALFADFTTVGTLFALLRYITWLQSAVKQASDAYVRLMAGAGSLERIVELHDRGVFGNQEDIGFDVRKRDEDVRDMTRKLSVTRSRKGDMSDADLQKPLLAAHGTDLLIEPEPVEGDRPNFRNMVGGVHLDDVFISYRSKTDKSVLTDCTIKAESGEMVLVVGEPGSGKTTLLSTIMLYTRPYKGSISYQLNVGNGCKEWAEFSFLKDPMRVARSEMSICSLATCGVFHATIEDNVACAAPHPASIVEVHDACRRVGLDQFASLLPDGLRTLIGEGTGRPLSTADQLRISLARAIVRKPKVLLIDCGEQYMEGIGLPLLHSVFVEIASRGGTVIVAAYHAESFPFIQSVYELKMGRPWPVPKDV